MKRLLPAVALGLATATVFGLVRGVSIFVPGVVGMLAGGISGYLTGRLGRHDCDALWPFAARGGITLGATLLYGVGCVAWVATVNAGVSSYPIEWLEEVLAGHAGELFVGTSKNSMQSVSGLLSGAWWVILVAVDGLLFAFLYLISLGIGLSSKHDATEAAEGVRQGSSAASRPPVDTGRPAFGIMGFGAFASATVALLVVLNSWPSIAVRLGGEAPVEVSAGALQGEWQFDEPPPFLGSNHTERRFTLSKGIRNEEIACYSAEPSLYMISMGPRRDGSFQGRILLRDRGALPVLATPSADGQQLVFVVRGMATSGAMTERSVTASRIGD